MLDLTTLWNIVKDCKDGDTLILENDTYAILTEQFNRVSWTAFHPIVGQFIKDILEAPEYKLPSS